MIVRKNSQAVEVMLCLACQHEQQHGHIDPPAVEGAIYQHLLGEKLSHVETF